MSGNYGSGQGVLRKIRGFTLIEMLIAIAILGLLFRIAYPSYNQSKRKSRRSDAAAAALTIQVAQEKFRGSCAFYAQSLGSSDTCGATAALSTAKASSTTSEGYYTMSIQANSATGNAYVIVATAVGDQANDTAPNGSGGTVSCASLTITYNSTNPTGLKAPANCWAK